MLYKNATDAFELLFIDINANGESFAGTKAKFNVSFTLDNSSDKGMISMDKSLAWLVANGKIDSKSAIEHVANLEAYEQYLGRININSNDLLDPISDIRENI